MRAGVVIACAIAGIFGISQAARAVVAPGAAPDPVVVLESSEHELVGGLIVKMRNRRQGDTMDRAAVSGLSASAGIALEYVRPMSGEAHVMALPGEMRLADAWDIAKRLMQDPAVEYAEPNARMWPMAVPSDPSYANQWHYHPPGVSAGGANLPGAWDVTTGAAGLTVAVIDTGLRPHSDIDSNILDGTGRVVPGYDFITSVTTANDLDGRDADPTDPGDWTAANECSTGSSARNSSWHGTHVAGTIGALSNNGVGVSGINWTSKILPVRVLGKCGGTLADIADGMRWAAGLVVPNVPNNPNPARVLNLSLGGGGLCETTYQNAINDIVAANSVVVVAAGNSNAEAAGFRPANCNNVITVAAVGPTGARAYYSNYGTLVGIAAPGGDLSLGPTSGVLSTLNAGTSAPAEESYAYYQGTSMATPHVAGIVSLMLSVNPALTPAQVLPLLQGSARAFPTGTARDCLESQCGAGIIDAAAAVAASHPAAPGLVFFVSSSVNAFEFAGMVTLSVARAGTSSGPASVNYSTVNGTATAGSDFTAVSGTLNWGNGDYSVKTISIPIVSDGLTEAPQTFTVILSAPSGATLGVRNVATIKIYDPEVFPGIGSMLANWTVPAGANAGWSLVTDQTSEGSFSLKSNPIYHGQRAQVELTANFQAGTVSFARRVSSESGWDFLRFYIDGVEQQYWSGELGWATVSYALGAGTHTLRWSYEKDAYCCVDGSDAAWIDAVVLPTVVAAPLPPVITSITPGGGKLIIGFTPTGGGAPAADFIASCSAPGKTTRTATGTASPIAVGGLAGGVTYTCSIAGRNQFGTGPSSTGVAGVPQKVNNLVPVLNLLLN